MADVRLIDANSVCKKIVKSIRCAEEWANEAKKQQDTHGLRCATEAKTSLLAMLARIHDEPTIEAASDEGWISVYDRLPELYENVLVTDSDGKIYISWIAEITETKSYFAYGSGSITHWRHLPEPPKGE